MNHQPGVKGVVRESVAQGINQALECPMIASYDCSKISYQSLMTWADDEIEFEIKQDLPGS